MVKSLESLMVAPASYARFSGGIVPNFHRRRTITTSLLLDKILPGSMKGCNRRFTSFAMILETLQRFCNIKENIFNIS